MVLHDEGSEARHAAGDGSDPATTHGCLVTSLLCIVELSALVPPVVLDPARPHLPSPRSVPSSTADRPLL